jgi:hypothetical protein
VIPELLLPHCPGCDDYSRSGKRLTPQAAPAVPAAPAQSPERLFPAGALALARAPSRVRNFA